MTKKRRDFTVTLYPAKLERGFYVTSFDVGQALPKKQFQAATADQVVAEIGAFAVEHGRPCNASVRLIRGRKPAGFDIKTSSLYYNMEPPLAS